MRSFSAAVALAVNRSGGSQQRSMWQSAEILVYCMSHLPVHGGVEPAGGQRDVQAIGECALGRSRGGCGATEDQQEREQFPHGSSLVMSCIGPAPSRVWRGRP